MNSTILFLNLFALWIFVLANILLTLALVRKANLERRKDLYKIDTLKIGEDAPDFIAESLTGEVVHRTDFSKSPLALVVFSPSCQPCREHITEWDALHPIAEKAGVELRLISIGDKKDTLTLASAMNLSSPILIATQTENQFSEDYKIPGTPAYYIISPDGKVKGSGFLDEKWHLLTDEWKYAKF